MEYDIMKTSSCDFCREAHNKEDLIETLVDENEIAMICESCKEELESNIEY